MKAYRRAFDSLRVASAASEFRVVDVTGRVWAFDFGTALALAVSFGGAEFRARVKNSARNFANHRRKVINPRRTDLGSKVDAKTKRLEASSVIRDDGVVTQGTTITILDTRKGIE
jgi:predicted fused transcriptional regulator/phosphomethylpyrimidine kinase